MRTIDSSLDEVHVPKTDRRVVRTRKAIKRAFDQLLAERPLDEITVSAIARTADIDRKTFYLHYATIDDLVQDISADNIREIEQFLKTEGAGKSMEECVHLVLQFINTMIAGSADRYRGVAASLSLDQIIERVEANTADAIKRIRLDQHQQAFPFNEEQWHMLLRFYLAGALALYREWLTSESLTSLEEVSQVVESILTSNVFVSQG